MLHVSSDEMLWITYTVCECASKLKLLSNLVQINYWEMLHGALTWGTVTLCRSQKEMHPQSTETPKLPSRAYRSCEPSKNIFKTLHDLNDIDEKTKILKTPS